MMLKSAVLATLLAIHAAALPRNSVLQRREDTCYFSGPGPVGNAQAVCAGSNGEAHEDVLRCPDQGVADRICGRDDVDPDVRDNCKRIEGSGTYCTVGGPLPNGGHHQCYCVNGNFCCSQNAEVPGGGSPVDYYKGAGCNCGAQL